MRIGWIVVLMAGVLHGQITPGGGGTTPGNAVTTVNGQPGPAVTLTAAQVGAAPIASFPFTPQCQFVYAGGSGTSWSATVGAFTTTISGTTQPSWRPEGLYFPGNQSSHAASIDGACINGANTLMVFYTPDSPTNYTQQNQFGFILSTDTGNGLIQPPGKPSQGPEIYNNVPAKAGGSVTGPIAACIVSGSAGNFYLYDGQRGSFPNTNIGTWSATSKMSLSEFYNNTGFKSAGTWHGFATFSQSLTQNQCQQAYKTFNYQLSAVGPVRANDTTDYSKPPVVAVGDSINEGFGGNFVAQDSPTLLAFRQLGLNSTYFNQSVTGSVCVDVQNNYANNTGYLLAKFASGAIVTNNCGTNDILGSNSASTILSFITSIAGLVHSSGAKYIHSTLLPRAAFTGAQETVRQSVNAGLISLMQNGTIDAIDDRASNAVMGLVSSTSNTTYYVDGTHPSLAGALLLAPEQARALRSVIAPLIPFYTSQIIPTGSAPTCTVGAAAGTGATCSILAGSTNMAGQITVTTGTATAASGTLVTVNFNGTLGTAPLNCPVMPRNAAAAANATDVFTTAPTTTGWTIGDGAATPAISTANIWGYGPCV